jgi:NitT/TauT family transport system substrate-binding protein
MTFSMIKQFAAVVLAMAIASLPVHAAPLSQEEINIAVGVDPAFSAIYLADQEHLFAKAGVNVKVRQYTQGGDAMDAVAAGQTQLGSAAEPTSLIRMAHSNIRAIAVYSQSGKYIKLVARDTISDPRQMKKFGIVPGSVSEYATEKLFQKYNIDPKSVELVKAGPPEFPALLVRGDVDGYFLWEPWPTLGVKQGGKVLLTSGDVGYVYNMWLSGSGPWLDSHHAEAEAILQAMTQACDEIRADPQKAGTASQAEVKIPAAQAMELLKDVDCRTRDFTPADLQSYDQIADFLVEHKITPSKVDVKKVIDTSFFKP